MAKIKIKIITTYFEDVSIPFLLVHVYSSIIDNSSMQINICKTAQFFGVFLAAKIKVKACLVFRYVCGFCSTNVSLKRKQGESSRSLLVIRGVFVRCRMQRMLFPFVQIGKKSGCGKKIRHIYRKSTLVYREGERSVCDPPSLRSWLVLLQKSGWSVVRCTCVSVCK